ncbi:bifunctional (p)ppGpp synthetase/guanosine-3',5'-bis(diphosphate) 3'-pyrophosphohydrolase [candidate division KSB1 bacterium]|nr:bifunctional (p)ppGpp synthetase/guanosine-3',5'-bis(diphosphate) 3'-pyrophosphohydrolase [candidate division KSB1 bacterium]
MLKSSWSPDDYARALRFAANAHQGQKYPGTDLPYLMHVSLVSAEVMAALSYEPERDGNLAVQCALLHDVIEDTPVTPAQLKVEFGERVALGVLALTKDEKLEKSLQMQDSLRRIQQQPPEIWMVKMADRIANLAPPPHYWTRNKKERYREEAVTIHRMLHPASEYLGKRLQAKIAAYESYYNIRF